jgi:hypothetical protein
MDRLLVKTLLGRAKGSPLDITADYYRSPIHDVTLFPPSPDKSGVSGSNAYPRTKLKIIGGHFWTPSTRTHEIDAGRYLDGPVSLVAPTLPLFKNAANLKNFVLRTGEFPSLRHFTFPHLTTLDFSTCNDAYPVSELLDFLEASPALRRIRATAQADRFREDTPPGRVIVLPCVKTFSLRIISYGSGCEIATHVSCPFAKRVEFEHWLECAGDSAPVAIYPPSTPWNAIVRQYTKGPVERVVFR